MKEESHNTSPFLFGGPMILENYMNDDMVLKDVTINCCKYCHAECSSSYTGGSITYSCPKCNHMRGFDETYQKTIQKQVPLTEGWIPRYYD